MRDHTPRHSSRCRSFLLSVRSLSVRVLAVCVLYAVRTSVAARLSVNERIGRQQKQEEEHTDGGNERGRERGGEGRVE